MFSSRALLLIYLVTIASGCARNTGEPTEFVTSHKPQSFFDEEAKKRGFVRSGKTASGGRSGSVADRRFQFTLTTEKVPMERRDEIGQRILREYAKHVESELKRIGAEINERGHSGPDKGGTRYRYFRFEYSGHRWLGFIHANCVLTHDGHVQIDIMIYEHAK